MSANVSKVLPVYTMNKVIISYPKLFVAEQFQGEGPFFFSAAFLIDPRKQADVIEGLTAACEAAADLKWPRSEWQDKRRQGPRTFWWPIRDGAEKVGKNGYAGRVFIQAKSETRPGVVDQDVQPIMDNTLIFPGCIVNAQVQFSGYSRPGWGVGCYLQNVQLVANGERLGGKPDPSSVFEPVRDTSEREKPAFLA
jgi:hypothetical protein